MEDLKITAGGYDFGRAHAAMQRYVDGNIPLAFRPRSLLAGISSM